MEFSKLKTIQQKHIENMIKDQDHLFLIDLDKDKFWDLYLSSFPAGTNEMYRKRREYDCSSCRRFIRMFGNVVTIKDNQVTTIWDVKDLADPVFSPVFKALDSYVRSFPVSNKFLTKEANMGLDQNFEDIDGQVHTWDHLFFKLPQKFLYTGRDTLESVQADVRSNREVFQRSMDQISSYSIEVVQELIASNSLYKGAEWEAVLKTFKSIQDEYLTVPEADRNNYCWIKSIKVGPVISKLKNHSIGTLLLDISAGLDLNEALRKYDSVVAPTNYKRPKMVYTKKQLEEARQKLEEMGLMNSLGRRYAHLSDITINNILFANKDAAKQMTGVFDKMSASVSTVNPKNFDRLDEISIEDFIKNVLPTTKNLEVLFENKHASNMVSLITAQNKDSPSLFKWDNSTSWAYQGNITDSMKERVKAAGGRVDGVLRFSIQWNDEGNNNSDLDAHCIEPKGFEIYYMYDDSPRTRGNLDVDIRVPNEDPRAKGGVAVENITWPELSLLEEGVYQFFVVDFCDRGGRSGFTAEIEFNGQVFSFSYNKPLRHKERIDVAKVKYSKADGFSLQEMLPATSSSREIWGLSTNQFHPVSVMMYSPNYWDLQEGIGNKHYFFMLKDCVNPDTPNGFFNEFLKQEFMEQRRVFEALGSEMKVQPDNDQLSGVGFSSTQRNSIVCKVEGAVSRTLKINF